jgi:DNA polymerase III subunit delta
MILFLYGSESYLLKQKLEQVIERAKARGTTDDGITKIDGGEAKLGQVRQALSAGSLFSAGRVVIIRDWLANHPASDNDRLVELLEGAAESTVIAVAEFSEPDRRLGAVKRLGKLASKSWQFAPLEPGPAVQWLTETAAERSIKFDRAIARKVVDLAGTDLWLLSNELDKLGAAARGQAVTEAMVDHLVASQEEGNIWELVDALGQGDGRRAAKHLRQLMADGEPPLRIFAMVVRQYRILLGVRSLLEAGASDAQMARQLGAHPFAIKKARTPAGKYSVDDLKSIFDQLADLDLAMKTGRRDPEEALELFVLERSESLNPA